LFPHIGLEQAAPGGACPPSGCLSSAETWLQRGRRAGDLTDKTRPSARLARCFQQLPQGETSRGKRLSARCDRPWPAGDALNCCWRDGRRSHNSSGATELSPTETRKTVLAFLCELLLDPGVRLVLVEASCAADLLCQKMP